MTHDHEGFAATISRLATKLSAIADIAPAQIDETDADSLQNAELRVGDICYEIDKCLGELAVQCGLMQHAHDSALRDGSELAWEISRAVRLIESEAPALRSDYDEHSLGAAQLGVGAGS
jgi:hypothetical protein